MRVSTVGTGFQQDELSQGLGPDRNQAFHMQSFFGSSKKEEVLCKRHCTDCQTVLQQKLNPAKQYFEGEQAELVILNKEGEAVEVETEEDTVIRASLFNHLCCGTLKGGLWGSRQLQLSWTNSKKNSCTVCCCREEETESR
jgi:hypothetical protein